MFMLTPAQAQGTLTLDWSKGPVRYHLESLFETPRSMLHQGVGMQMARATRQRVTAGHIGCGLQRRSRGEEVGGPLRDGQGDLPEDCCPW